VGIERIREHEALRVRHDDLLWQAGFSKSGRRLNPVCRCGTETAEVFKTSAV
jgi:hypothetical protein